jgi:hypothetical protein
MIKDQYCFLIDLAYNRTVSGFGEIKLMTKMKRSQGCGITLTGEIYG